MLTLHCELQTKKLQRKQMNRLSKGISQTHLRSLALKHGLQNAASSEKIDSPLIKVNANGSVTCVICRSNLKSVSLWKVHINSKAHKNNVKEAKLMKDAILNSKPPASTQKTVFVQQKELAERKVEDRIVTAKAKETNNKDIQEGQSASNIETSKTTLTRNPLPEEFFDASAAEAKARNEEINAAEWEQFQKEIQEVSRASHDIFVNDQKNLAVEREIVEINEQLHHWSKVLDLENKREKLHQIVEMKKDQRRISIDNVESSEDEAFEEYPDWRSKGFK